MEQREHASNMAPILKVIKEQLTPTPSIIECLDTNELSNLSFYELKTQRTYKGISIILNGLQQNV